MLTLRKLVSFINRNSILANGNHYPIISFNNKKILGFIDCYAFENGFSMLTVDLKTLTNFAVKNDTPDRINGEHSFFIYFNENTLGSMKWESGKEQPIADTSLFITSGTRDEISFKKGTTINGFVFIAAKTWLQQQGIQFQKNFLAPLCKAEILFYKNMKRYQETNKNLLRLRITAYSLLLYSLERHSNKRKMVLPSEKNHSEVLDAVEQKILDHLYTSAPSIDEIAREFYMSPSTLKRQFKRVFGSNIYEYYLKHKMQLAKDILEHKQLKVSEVAEQLHYENVSQFIRIFKKINGFLPGEIAK
jgi:AraC-like DNA-binding protein